MPAASPRAYCVFISGLFLFVLARAGFGLYAVFYRGICLQHGLHEVGVFFGTYRHEYALFVLEHHAQPVGRPVQHDGVDILCVVGGGQRGKAQSDLFAVHRKERARQKQHAYHYQRHRNKEHQHVLHDRERGHGRVPQPEVYHLPQRKREHGRAHGEHKAQDYIYSARKFQLKNLHGTIIHQLRPLCNSISAQNARGGRVDQIFCRCKNFYAAKP